MFYVIFDRIFRCSNALLNVVSLLFLPLRCMTHTNTPF